MIAFIELGDTRSILKPVAADIGAPFFFYVALSEILVSDMIF